MTLQKMFVYNKKKNLLWIRIRISFKTLDPDLYEIDADTKP